jgi:anti-sigma-K factor RskA
MNLQSPALSDRLAAEYVLGTLHGAARRRFEQLLSAHPGLRRAVADWERRLNRLAVASPSAPPPPIIWQHLDRRLFPAPLRRPWWDRLPFWRGLALAGVLAAMLVIAPHGIPPPTAEATFAAIRSPQNDVLWTVARAADGQLHVSNLQPLTIPHDQHCFLWLKTRDQPPVMLGVLPDDGGARTLAISTRLAPSVQKGELWVTMQPATQATPPVRPAYQGRWQTL